MKFGTSEKTSAGINVGGTVTVCQVYRGSTLVGEWRYSTQEHRSLFVILRDSAKRIHEVLGHNADFVGLCFAGPMGAGGAPVFTNAMFDDSDQVTMKATSKLFGAPTVHLNDVEASAWMLSQLPMLDIVHLFGNEHGGNDGIILTEIGTGVGTGLFLQSALVPHGLVLPSEIQHVYGVCDERSGRHHSYEDLLCGSRGFTLHYARITEANLYIAPDDLKRAVKAAGNEPGPVITEFMRKNPGHPFSKAFASRYGAALGAFLRTLQLTFQQAELVAIGGSIGRAEGFLEMVMATPAFTAAFIGTEKGVKNVQEARRSTFRVIRVCNPDLTVHGARLGGLRVALATT